MVKRHGSPALPTASEDHALLLARHRRKSFGNSGCGDVSGRPAALYDSFHI